jgi:flagellar motor switch protein FliG
VSTEALSGSEKAAVLLLSLGPDVATEVMRHLGEEEVRKVVQAVARVRSVEGDRLDAVNREFVETMTQTRASRSTGASSRRRCSAAPRPSSRSRATATRRTRCPSSSNA